MRINTELFKQTLADHDLSLVNLHKRMTSKGYKIAARTLREWNYMGGVNEELFEKAIDCINSWDNGKGFSYKRLKPLNPEDFYRK